MDICLSLSLFLNHKVSDSGDPPRRGHCTMYPLYKGSTLLVWIEPTKKADFKPLELNLFSLGEVKFRTSPELMGDSLVHFRGKLLCIISPRGMYVFTQMIFRDH